MKRVIVFLLLIIVSNCYIWDVYLQYNEGYCESVQPNICIPCGNTYYKVLCGDQGPSYENVVYSDCIAYHYNDINCEDNTYNAIQIRAYSPDDICDEISASYSGTYCEFGAYYTDNNIVVFLVMIICIILILLIIVIVTMIIVIIQSIIRNRDKINQSLQLLMK